MDRIPTNRRRHTRRRYPNLETRLGHEVYPAVDWSMGGLAVRDLADCLNPDSFGTEITGYFGVSGGDIAFKYSATIMRIDIDQDLVGLDFTVLWPESTEILSDLMRRPPILRQPLSRPRPARSLINAIDAARSSWVRRRQDSWTRR